MDEKLTVAEILKPQGIKGELKIKTLTDFPEDVKAFERLYIDGVSYRILSFRTCGDNFAYVYLRGVPDRNAAELLRGKKLYALREDAPELPEGTYYVEDLLGFAVETEKGELLGTLKEITSLSSDIYTIEKDGKEILFPAVNGVIVRVESDKKKIVVDKDKFSALAVL